MSKSIHVIYYWLIALYVSLGITTLQAIPQLTVVIVIDQFAYHYVPTLRPYFNHGLRMLFEHGIVYTNAYVPYALPATAPGHASLNTGTNPCTHGIIANSWVNEHGISIASDDDNAQNAAVLKPDGTGTYAIGKSAINVMVDGISDQYALNTTPEQPFYTYALSYKSHAAITAAGKLGKAIWLDQNTGLFTSSKAYFTQLPLWLQTFNAQHTLHQKSPVRWHLRYPHQSPAYYRANPQTYEFVFNHMSIVNKPISITMPTPYSSTDPYDAFIMTPYSTPLLLQLAQHCIDNHVHKKSSDHLLLWICISGLDEVGHLYGPDSIEAIDTIYHLDKQIGNFITSINKKVGAHNVLFVLTADHGISPIVELIQKKGFAPAQRIMATDFIEKANNFIKKKHAIPSLITSINQPNIYLNTPALTTRGQQKRHIMHDLLTYLSQQSGIQHVWTYYDLARQCFTPDQIGNLFKQQLYPGRSGQIIIQTLPYVLITKHRYGTAHQTPYEYDTHVPLIVYQEGTYENKIITKKVWSLQLAHTLAHILQVSKPSASTCELLPGI